MKQKSGKKVPIFVEAKMVTREFEIVFDEEITDLEVEWFKKQLPKSSHCTMGRTNRIMLVDGFQDINELIKALAKNEFMMDIMNIKEIVNYEPEWNMVELGAK